MSTKPTDELLDHEYDGIREFDNPIPAWWHWLWIGSIVFSLFYFTHYHITNTGQGVLAAYAADMEKYRAIEAERAAALAASMSEDILLAAMTDAEKVELGRTKYGEICAACHADQGQGLIGPNLTDPYWIHADGSLMAIRSIVSEGVAEKGMPAWEKILSPDEMVAVVAFVGTIRNTNVEGKEPEGKKVEGKAADAESEAADS